MNKVSVFTNADLFRKWQNKKAFIFWRKIRVLYIFFLLFIMPFYVNLFLWCLLLRYNSVFCEQLTIYCAKTTFIYHNKTCQNSWLTVFVFFPIWFLVQKTFLVIHLLWKSMRQGIASLNIKIHCFKNIDKTKPGNLCTICTNIIYHKITSFTFLQIHLPHRLTSALLTHFLFCFNCPKCGAV